MTRATVIAFGYHDQQAPRHWNVCAALREEGYTIVECHTEAKGLLGKYRDLYKKFRQLKTPVRVEALLVSFPGHYLVPLAWMLTRLRPLGSGGQAHPRMMFDAFISLYDTNVCDRKRVSHRHPRAWLWYIVDFISCHLADEILLDTEEHKKYFTHAFRLRPEKIRVIYLGSRPDLFFPKARSSKLEARSSFKILFYGSYIPLHGIEHILDAAALLQNRRTNVHITLVGKGQTLPAMRRRAEVLHLRNTTFREWAPYEELPDLIRGSDVCLGIFGNTPKARRVIPHKVYDAVACGVPVITADSPAVRERFAGSPHVLLCAAADPRDLAEKIAALAPPLPPSPHHIMDGARQEKPVSSPLAATPNKESSAWIRIIEEGKGYAAIDASLFQTLIGRITEYAFFRALRRRIRPGDAVLEVGCGWAMSSFALAGEGGVSVTALDIAEKLIADLRRLQKELGGSYATHLTLVAGDAFRLHEMERTFDVVFSDGTYEHFLQDEDRRKFLEQVRTVLRNGGIFSVAVPNLHNPFFRSVVNPKMPAMYPFTLRLLATELRQGGFRPLETGYSFVNPGFEQWVRSHWMVRGIRFANILFRFMPRPAKRMLAAHLYCIAQKA